MYNGPTSGPDIGNGIAVDNDGNVYVSGMASEDIWIRKYDSNGSEVWTQTYNGPDNRLDIGWGIAFDSVSNIYITGEEFPSSYPLSPDINLWIRGSNTNGTPGFTQTWNIGGLDGGYGLTVDGSGNIVVIGQTSDVFNANLLLLKFNDGGTLLGMQSFDYGRSDEGRDIAADNLSGDYFGIGAINTVTEGKNIIVGRYGMDLSLIRDTFYNGPSNGDDEGGGIAVDDITGNVFIVGTVSSPDEGRNIFVASFDDNLSLLPDPLIYNGGSNGDDYGNGIIGENNGIYITGSEFTTGEDSNALTMRLNRELQPICIQTNNGPSSSSDGGRDIAIDSTGANIYVTGHETILGEDRNIWVRKYSGF